ncbi:MAG: hypothetical protein C5S49_08475 [Candidatus Methanogaster sp.]|nr:MAG: hypothetical protein C5S49_08475 [ANME-2 cluster archaeon]
MGGALEFDGVDDYVLIWDSSAMNANVDTTVGSVEVWFKPFEIPTLFVYEYFNGANDRLYLSVEPDSTICFAVGDTTYKKSIGTVNIQEWVHHTAVWYPDGTVKVYINGNSDFKFSFGNPGFTFRSDENFYLGRGWNRNPLYFTGTIDEVRIYNRALTAEEIKTHYEQKPTALALTKSAAPHSIKQGQTTTITLTVKNTGTTEITDIEVADTIPSDPIFIDGETSKTYTSLRPKDSREFQYTIQLNEAGTFNLDPATATYSDEEGNYHTTESETATTTVIPSTDQPTTPKPSTEISTASVHLHGEKTDVVLGEEVLLKLSAVNIIGNPLMRVQVIIIPPSGWSVTSSEFAKSGAGQYTTTYDIKEGVGRDIEVRIMPNQIGDDFHVQGRIIYYFGDDPAQREDHTLTLPITVRAEAEPGAGAEQTAETLGSEEKGSSMPGFAAVVAIVGLLAAYLRRRRI